MPSYNTQETHTIAIIPLPSTKMGGAMTSHTLHNLTFLILLPWGEDWVDHHFLLLLLLLLLLLFYRSFFLCPP